MRKNIFVTLASVLLLIIPFALTNCFHRNPKNAKNVSVSKPASVSKEWKAPDTSQIAHSQQGDEIRYGRNLVLHTSIYLGPKGTLGAISNGMNCGNCHMEGGTRPWGNNFSRAASAYPLFRNRSGKIETVEMRINDCFERSLNGKKIADSGREMKAMVAYINWVGKDVSKETQLPYAATESLPFLNRAADTLKGKMIYISTCQKCHGKNGGGILAENGKEYLYPPLWGSRSYNVGAGMYQLSKLAGFIKNNMPFGATYKTPQLTNEQAWDVAAFVNSKPRPSKNLKMDWPDVSTKPFDYPFGPYSDQFSAMRHKYGPFEEIQKAHKPRFKSS